MSTRFRLSESFLEPYKTQRPPFGFNGLGELVYLRTYSRPKSDGQNERWWETVRRVVEGCYSIQKRHITENRLGWNQSKGQKSAQEMYDRIFNMKFLPPGRGLWAMGTELTEERDVSAALFNCFAYETEIITREGIKAIGECAGTSQSVLTINGQWVDAPVRSFGKQRLQKITLTRQGQIKEIFATPEHRWFAKSPSDVNHHKGWNQYTTQELKTKYRLQYCFGQSTKAYSPSPFGIAHGVTFGDGTTAVNTHLHLCGDKDAELLPYFQGCRVNDASEKNAVMVCDLPNGFKKLPPITETRQYLLGWLMGYFAADGSVYKSGQAVLCSYERTNLEFVQSVCAVLGIGTYEIIESERESNLTGRDHKSWKLTFMRTSLDESFFLLSEHRKRFLECEPETTTLRYWNVVSVEDTDRFEEVYCATVDGKGAFTLAGNILTGNCAFISTESIKEELEESFTFLMDASMLGVGVGFDVKGAGKIEVKGFNDHTVAFDVEDCRESWVESVGLLIRNAILGLPKPLYDYSRVRPAGLPIKGFGGVSSGPAALESLHTDLINVFARNAGKPISIRTIVDAMNMIGRCVVAGNIRRTAEIVFGPADSEEYLDLKDYRWDSESGQYVGEAADRAAYGWTSNNSVFADLGMDYTRTGDQAGVNGEPGFAWLENMQKSGRMCEPPNNKDHRVRGANPCTEQSLESGEACCLVETYPDNHDSFADYKRTLKFAYLYAKTVTLCKTHWEKMNRVMLRNRRIGCSMSGIQQFVAKNGIHEYKRWCEEGYNTIQYYDEVYSDWFAIPRSIKTTSIKPSGTVSLLSGSTPGMHWPEALYYIRRMRLAKDSPLVPALKKAGYRIEPAFEAPKDTLVVEIPVKVDDCGGKLRTVSQVSMWEQVAMAAMIQRYWADNQVSCTVTFDPSEGGQIKHALDYFQYDLKGISFLPKVKSGAYAQMPYEEITAEAYLAASAKLKPINFGTVAGVQAEVERFCDGTSCVIS